jgi:hypothetical protein
MDSSERIFLEHKSANEVIEYDQRRFGSYVPNEPIDVHIRPTIVVLCVN